jgi:hypothetical protein
VHQRWYIHLQSCLTYLVSTVRIEGADLTLTRRLEVADSKGWRDVRANVGQGVTYLNRAADRKGVFPDDLGEVTPFLEVGHVRVVISVSRIEPDLVVVHQVGDQLVSLVGEKPSTDVLAIATTAGLTMQRLARTRWKN